MVAGRRRETRRGWTKFSCGASGLRNCAVSGPHPQDGLNSVVARPVCGAAPDQARTRRTNSIQLCASGLRNCPAQLPRIRSATAVRTVIDQSYRQDAGEVTSPQEGPTEAETECASGEEVIPLGAVVPRNTAATTGTPLLDGGVLEHLKLVDFTVLNGYKVSFDENGDTAAKYDLLNWQYKEDDSMNVINIGHYDNSLPEGQRFSLTPNTAIIWALNSTEPPKSVCRDACPAGSRKAINKHAPVCCFDCFECPEGGISNKTDSSDCFFCSLSTPSNSRSHTNPHNVNCSPNTPPDSPSTLPHNTDHSPNIPPSISPSTTCHQILEHMKLVDFTVLNGYKPMGIALTVVSLIGAVLSLSTVSTFLYHRETPVIKFSNFDLNCLLLFSLFLCFLCPLTFIGRPTLWTCM
ncbi:unnamed protein product [Gadus morhua 'NCC']